MNYREILIKNRVQIKDVERLDGFFRKSQVLFEVKDNKAPLPDQIFEVLMNPIIRRGDGILLATTQENYLDQIEKYVLEGRPIETVFLGLPFKCHNPIETMRRTPDLGELAFLLRLTDIDQTIKQIYPPGMTFTVLKEGTSYASLFGATSEEIKKFETILAEFVTRTDAGEVIKLVDLGDVCAKFPDFNQVRQEQEIIIKNFVGDDRKEVDKFMDVMTRSLPVLADIPIADLLKVYQNISDDNVALDDYQTRLREYLALGAEDLAVSYIAFQKTKNQLQIMQQTFPDKLYFSTTTKHTRYSFHPLHRRTKLFPHHGVPLLTTDKVDVCFLKDVLLNPQEFVAVFCKDDHEDAPFYFLKGRQHVKNNMLNLEL